MGFIDTIVMSWKFGRQQTEGERYHCSALLLLAQLRVVLVVEVGGIHIAECDQLVDGRFD